MRKLVIAALLSVLMSLEARPDDITYPWHLKDPVPPESVVEPVRAGDTGEAPQCAAANEGCEAPEQEE